MQYNKKCFFKHSINMTNPQLNEIEQIERDINLLQDKLKKLKNEKKRIAKMPKGSKRIAKKNKIHKKNKAN